MTSNSSKKKTGAAPPLHKGKSTQNFRSTPCIYFALKGYCEYGDRCWFSHDILDLAVPEELLPKQYRFYKTALCKAYTRKGHCDWGDRCQFAHGEHELRPVNDLDPVIPNCRRPCNKVDENGNCPYGSKCKFMHNTDKVSFKAEENDEQVEKENADFHHGNDEDNDEMMSEGNSSGIERINSADNEVNHHLNNNDGEFDELEAMADDLEKQQEEELSVDRAFEPSGRRLSQKGDQEKKGNKRTTALFSVAAPPAAASNVSNSSGSATAAESSRDASMFYTLWG